MRTQIRIKHFGPIKEGFSGNGGWMTIEKLTILIGNQGSGKSTVAKLFSTLSWIEKALVRGDFLERELTPSRFRKHCSYQNIGNYFTPTTEIEYKGNAFYIRYTHADTTVEKNSLNGYSFPKIMYVPAERNLVSTAKNVRALKGLPSTLYTFADEFFNAAEEAKERIELPLNNVYFEYQKLNKLSWIVGNDYKLKLTEASSGFQSFVPLYIVSNYLTNAIQQEQNDPFSERSIEEGKRIRNEIKSILDNPHISEEVKRISLEELSKRIQYTSFINIVEEPEQNLFPTSQYKLLNSLFQFTTTTEANKLILTTHSPYMISYATIAIQAGELKKKLTTDTLRDRLAAIIPLASTLNTADVVIYQLDEKDGTINRLPAVYGIPSSKNYLNQFLAESNELFDQLLEIEQEL